MVFFRVCGWTGEPGNDLEGSYPTLADAGALPVL
jgi:hypothetical protein